MAEFAYSNKKHTATQILLLKANYGLSPRMEFEGKTGKRFEAAEEFAERIRQVQEEVKAMLGKVQEEIKKYADRKRKKGTEFKASNVRVANSKPELSQLLFISVRQRELVKSSRWIGLSTYTSATWSVHYFPALPCDLVTCDVTV